MDTTGSSLTQETVTFPAAAEALDALHDALDRFWTRADATSAPPPASRWRLEFATALAEIVANVVKHAAPPHGVELRFELVPGRVEAHLRDDGLPYRERPAPAALPADVALDDLPEGGYGLALARGALDDLRYERRPDGTNHWLLVKTWPDPTPGGPR